MNNTFFTELCSLIDNNDSINITILKKSDKVIVSVLPKSFAKDKTLENISSITLSGTTQELDNEFINSVKTPISKFTEFSVEAKAFEITMEKAKEESEIAKSKKDEAKKTKEKVDKLFEEVKAADEAKDITKLREIYKKIEDLDKSSKHLKTITDMANKIKTATMAATLFEEQPVQVEEQSDISPNQTNLLDQIPQ